MILQNKLNKQEQENEVDLGFFLEISEEDNIIYNQVPLYTLIEDMEKLKIGFFTFGKFSLGDDGEIDINGFFKDSTELAEFIDKILDKHDDYPSVYYTGNFVAFFNNFKRVNRPNHGIGAKEFNKIVEYEGENC